MFKKLILLFLLIIPFVISGKSYYVDLSDDSGNDAEVITLSERDIIRINFTVRDYQKPEIVNGEERILYLYEDVEEDIMVRQVNEDKNSVDLTAFVKGSEVPFYVTINPKIVINLDFERDDLIDLSIGLSKVEGNKVTLILKKNMEKAEPKLDSIARKEGWYDKEEENFMDKIDDYKYYAIIVPIILFIILKRKFIKKKIRMLRRKYIS